MKINSDFLADICAMVENTCLSIFFLQRYDSSISKFSPAIAWEFHEKRIALAYSMKFYQWQTAQLLMEVNWEV